MLWRGKFALRHFERERIDGGYAFPQLYDASGRNVVALKVQRITPRLGWHATSMMQVAIRSSYSIMVYPTTAGTTTPGQSGSLPSSVGRATDS